MLVLQRKKNQSLVIGGDITVSILEIGSDWIKLAIEAPKDVKILRAELMEAAKANQEAAKKLSTESVNTLKTLVMGWGYGVGFFKEESKALPFLSFWYGLDGAGCVSADDLRAFPEYTYRLPDGRNQCGDCLFHGDFCCNGEMGGLCGLYAD